MQRGEESNNVKSSLHYDKIINDTSSDIVDVVGAVLEASIVINDGRGPLGRFRKFKQPFASSLFVTVSLPANLSTQAHKMSALYLRQSYVFLLLHECVSIVRILRVSFSLSRNKDEI